MAFNDIEMSTDAGRPAILVEFSRPGRTWRYTNMEEDIEFDGNTYTAVPMTVSDLTQSSESSNDAVSFDLPESAPFAQYLDSTPISVDISATMRKLHIIEDPQGGMMAPGTIDAPVAWVGTYSAIKRNLPNSRTIVCNTISISMARGGLRLSWSRGCQHFLYKRGCYVNAADYEVIAPAAPVIVSGLQVNIPGLESIIPEVGYFTGGYIQWELEPGIVERRWIERHSTLELYIFGTTYLLDQGSNWRLYPGCNRTPYQCENRFNNILNYGGINHLQGRSPFDGNPIF